MVDPTNLSAVDDLAFRTGTRVSAGHLPAVAAARGHWERVRNPKAGLASALSDAERRWPFDETRESMKAQRAPGLRRPAAR